tara:strand:- start:434 stop:1189 length:756 start_codon:yes stop_codon:yes gene_type:complete
MESYIVKEGDILGRIAINNKVPLNDLIKFNNIKNPNKIQVGQELFFKQQSPVKQTTTEKRLFTKREKEIAKLIKEFFPDATPEGRAAIMGNIRQEAGAAFLGNTVQYGKNKKPLPGGAQYVLQLEQGEDSSGYHFRNYNRWVTEVLKGDVYDIKNQFTYLNSLIYEPNHYVNKPFLEPNSKFKSRKLGRTFGQGNRDAIIKSFNSGDVRAATIELEDRFFRAGDPNIEERVRHAEFYLPLFGEQEIIDEFE